MKMFGFVVPAPSAISAMFDRYVSLIYYLPSCVGGSWCLCSLEDLVLLYSSVLFPSFYVSVLNICITSMGNLRSSFG